MGQGHETSTLGIREVGGEDNTGQKQIWRPGLGRLDRLASLVFQKFILIFVAIDTEKFDTKQFAIFFLELILSPLHCFAL